MKDVAGVMKVIVSGAGIGGLSAAIALRLRGVDVHVVDQVSRIDPIGAGLQISPNGYKVLEKLGLNARIRDAVFEPEALEMRIGVTGRNVFKLPLKNYARQRWGAPYLHIHRGDLQQGLLERFRELGGKITLNRRITGYERTGKTVSAIWDQGREDADLLIGADGLHSNIRAQMHGNTKPRFTGQIAWRCLVPASLYKGELPPPTACVWVGDKRHAVTTRVHAGHCVNFVGVVEVGRSDAAESWAATGGKADALADFDGFQRPIIETLEKSVVVHKWALFDRPPLSGWSDGPVVLLGDAAHPMLPSMAQGATMAIEDAWVLAQCQAYEGQVHNGLSSYEEIRKPRSARVQALSASNAQLFHQATPIKGRLFYGAMGVAARLAPNLLQSRQDWVYGHDVSRVSDPHEV